MTEFERFIFEVRGVSVATRTEFLETVALPIELYPCGAENETRTRDPNLGKVVLYQLSYFRMATRTRLELVTSAVTGRHSNQLNHRAVCQFT